MEQFFKASYIDKYNSIVHHYYQQAKDAEKNITKESNQALKLQTKFRAYKLSGNYREIRKATVFIQRVLRGFMARILVKRAIFRISNERNLRYFNNQAVIIQRYFRGYYKRKYYHDFQVRRKYLQFLQTRNERFKTEIQEIEQAELIQQKYIHDQIAKEEFVRLASNLHHLSSTTIQPGVYNKPFASNPKVFDLEIETHLRTVFHSNYPAIKLNQTARYKEEKCGMKRFSSSGKLNFTAKLKPLS